MNYPKSQTLRLIEGDRGHRTKEQKSKDYFPVPIHPPSRPRDLSGEARKYWNKYVKIYRITEADVSLFQYLCELIGEINFLKEEIKTSGRMFVKVSVDGAGIEHQEFKTHPLVNQLGHANKERRILEKDFSRRYVYPVGKEEDDLSGNIR